MSSSPANTITLKTADDKFLHVETPIAMEFVAVRNFFADDDAKLGTPFPLPNVTEKYLILIIEYTKQQLNFREDSTPEEEKSKYDEEFVAKLEDSDLKEILLAVNYLDIKSFLDVLCQAIADRIKDWSVERVREFFGIANDFTPEEELKIRQDHAWAHEDQQAVV
ncbi:SKP1-like 12 [Euphorbia peplus]|nr:SKP1-like 12 [Euphorbia peplus]